MIHDYCKEKCGMVSLWFGNFQSQSQLDGYLSTVYQQDDEEDALFQEKLNALFILENKNRPCENELRSFYDEFYNQFEYDFGMTFNCDFLEAVFFQNPMDDISAMLKGASYCDTFTDSYSRLLCEKLKKQYNALILIYDCHYIGSTTCATHQGYEIEFMGSVPFIDS